MATYTEGTAQDTNTLAGLLRINDANLSDVEFNDLIQPTAFMRVLPFTLASRGTQHSWTVRTQAPGVAFRELNAGVDNDPGKEQTITANLKLLDASFERDKATVVSPRMSRDQYLDREAMLSLNEAMSTVEHQLIQGTASKATGFGGLGDVLNIWGDMGIDVEGNGGTRVYMLALGIDRVAGILGANQVGQEGNIEVSDTYEVAAVDGSGNRYGAFRKDITGWLGLQLAGSYSGGAAFNIDGTSEKTVDDDLLASLYAKFPTAHAPFVNCVLMSRVGWKQYRDSLSTDLIPAPQFANTWMGAGRPIPIVVSDAIDDDEDKQEES